MPDSVLGTGDPAVSETHHPCPWGADVLGGKTNAQGDVLGFARETEPMGHI